MCRLCGRVVKCIFDSMPSRTFTFANRSTTRPLLQRQAMSRTFASLSRSPRHTSAPLRSIPRLTPRIFASQINICLSPLSTSQSTPAQTSTFSTSSTLGQKRWTYNPSRRVQKRRHGFLARVNSANGQKIIKRRRAKGRKMYSW